MPTDSHDDSSPTALEDPVHLAQQRSKARNAIRNNDATRLASILHSCPAIKISESRWIRSNGPESEGLLHEAAFLDHVDCVCFLVEEGFDMHDAVAAKDLKAQSLFNANSPMSWALMCSEPTARNAMFKAMLAKSPREVGGNGRAWQMAMGEAASKQRLDIMHEIDAHLGVDARYLWVDEQGPKGNTLLHKAAVSGDIGLMDALLTWDGMPALLAKLIAMGRPPSEMALRCGHKELAAHIDARAQAFAEAEQVAKHARPAAAQKDASRSARVLRV